MLRTHYTFIQARYVTHDQSETLTMSNRIAVFNDGVIQQLSTPEGLYERPENAFVAQFIGENNRLVGSVAERNGEVCSVTVGGGEAVQALAVSCGGAGEATALSLRPERVQLPGVRLGGERLATDELSSRVAEAAVARGRCSSDGGRILVTRALSHA